MKISKLIILLCLSQISLVTAMNETEDERFLADVTSEANKLQKKYTQEVKNLNILPDVLVDIVMGYADLGHEIIETYNLYNAITSSDIDGMKRAIGNGADINLSAGDNTTVLIKIIKMFRLYSYTEDLLDFVEYLISKGANVNAQDNSGDTPLMLAVQITSPEYRSVLKEKSKLITLLLNNRANANIKNIKGETALMFAASLNDVDLVKELIQYGADQSIMNNAYQTAYSYTTNSKVKEMLGLAFKKEQEVLNKKRELELAKEIEQKRMQETSKKQEKINEKLNSLTSEMIKQQYSKNVQKREELQRQKEEERLRVQRAEEALAQMAAQPQEENWGDEPVEGSGEAEEDWGELEQED